MQCHCKTAIIETWLGSSRRLNCHVFAMISIGFGRFGSCVDFQKMLQHIWRQMRKWADFCGAAHHHARATGI